MMLRRILLLMSMLALAIVGASLHWFPAGAMGWFADSSVRFQLLRSLLVAVLAIQIVTTPPRNSSFRGVSGVLALSVGTWTYVMAAEGYLMPIDIITFTCAALSIGITALELKPKASAYILNSYARLFQV